MSEEATKQKAVTSETFIYLSLWFILNIVITVYSKVIFSVHEFPYSFLMTAIHMAVTMTGVATGFATGFFKARAQLSGESLLKLVQFSFVFTLNIWLSNAALNAVSIEMHQVVRSLVPIATMVISLLLYNKAYSWSLLPSVAMICGGVILTVSGAPSVEASGLAITVASLFMASVKGIMTQQMQVGDLGLSAPELLLYMSPMALVELLVAAEVSGEISSLIESGGVSSTLGWHLFGVGLVACALNVVSFRSAGLATPLTMNVLSNIKQVLTCVLGVILFNGGFTLGLSAGIIVTSVGCYLYSEASRTASQPKTEQQKGHGSQKVASKVSREKGTLLQPQVQTTLPTVGLRSHTTTPRAVGTPGVRAQGV